MPLAPDIYKRIVAAKLHMERNYHRQLNLREVSEKAFLSRFHFHRLFTGIYRLTPHEYLTNTRLDAAKKILRDETASIADVCNRVGFESAGSFSNLFKRQFGCTPLDYRKTVAAKKAATLAQPRKFIPQCFADFYAGAE